MTAGSLTSSNHRGMTISTSADLDLDAATVLVSCRMSAAQLLRAAACTRRWRSSMKRRCRYVGYWPAGPTAPAWSCQTPMPTWKARASPAACARPATAGDDLDAADRCGARAIGMQVALLDEMTSLSEVELAEQLMAWMHPAKRATSSPLADGRSIVVRGEGVDSGWNFADLSFHVMNLSMIAPGGVIESAELHAAICGFGEVDGHRSAVVLTTSVFNRIYPAAVGGTAGACAVSCRNDGRITSYPTITFHAGPVTNPEVHNAATQVP